MAGIKNMQKSFIYSFNRHFPSKPQIFKDAYKWLGDYGQLQQSLLGILTLVGLSGRVGMEELWGGGCHPCATVAYSKSQSMAKKGACVRRYIDALLPSSRKSC